MTSQPAKHSGGLIKERREWEGAAASPGIGMGPAYIVDRRLVHVPHTHIQPEQVEAEKQRFHHALQATRQQIDAIKDRLPHGEHLQILRAQQMMLRDPDWISRAEVLIGEELRCAEWAVAAATDEILDMFDEAADQYFRERRSDIVFLVERLLQQLLGDHWDELTPPEGSVVIAHDLSPADTAQLHRCRVAGIVTGVGGRTSHSAIMARSLQIPAVVGIGEIVSETQPGDLVVVDGIHGIVIIRPTPTELVKRAGERERYAAFEQKVRKEMAFPAISLDGLRVITRANLSFSEDLELILLHGAEGIGLYRSEYMFMNRNSLPTEEEHYRMAKAAIHRAAPYPVVFRTFDLGSDKLSKLINFPSVEKNPAMGMRSLRLALRERKMFLEQLRGLLRAGVHGPLRIMLPLVSSLDELEDGLSALEEARQQLADAGLAHADDIAVGVMIETPAAAMIADVLAKRVDFMSIGTNDLIQYTLAIDRENDDVGYLYQPLHPAILRLISRTAKAAAEQGISVSICGEMAGEPRYTWILLGLGITELSMQPSAIPVIKNIVRSSTAVEMRELAQRVLAAESSQEAEEIVFSAMNARFSEHLEHGDWQTMQLEPPEQSQAVDLVDPDSAASCGEVLEG